MDLPTVWYALVVACWVLFFVLEGFDFGVGLLTPVLGRTDHERGAAVRTIGPFWDGNEVWLVAAVGVTYAAFPSWYASMLAGLYLPMVVILLLLAGRGVALEFRGKGPDERWRRRCDAVLAACSLGVVLAWGAVLTVLLQGLAVDATGEVRGTGPARTLAPVLQPAALVGALVALAAAVLLGATFLALRTTGPLRSRARVLATAVAGGLALAVAFEVPWAALACAAVALAAWWRREALAFALSAVLVAGAVATGFAANLADGVVLRSTLDPAWSLTLAGAAASEQALRLISVAGLVVLPGVLVYQGFSYVVFRRRVSSERVAA